MSNQIEKKIVNLTPHDIKVLSNGREIIFSPSGKVCRVEFVKSDIGSVNDIGIKQVKIGEIINYPNKDNEVYIVSSIVAMQLVKLNYDNYIVPDTDDAIRDENGNIIAVKNFIKY